jgi:hypothetical protein
MLNRIIIFVFSLISLTSSLSAAGKFVSIRSAESLLKAIHNSKNNVRDLTFSQTVTFYNPEGSVLRTLDTFVSRQRSGFQRLDVVPLKDRKATLYRDGSIFEFQDGSLAFQKKVIDPEIKLSLIPAEYTILLLNCAVYSNPLKEVINKLKEAGFDLSKFHEETWQNRKVYIVGANQGNLQDKQFWIDQERLVLVRLIQPGKKQETGTFDIQFNNFEKVKNTWEFREASYKFNGKPERQIVRTNFRSDNTLPDDLFSPDKFVKPEWIKE